jgi:hypothetical protein
MSRTIICMGCFHIRDLLRWRWRDLRIFFVPWMMAVAALPCGVARSDAQSFNINPVTLAFGDLLLQCATL